MHTVLTLQKLSLSLVYGFSCLIEYLFLLEQTAIFHCCIMHIYYGSLLLKDYELFHRSELLVTVTCKRVAS